MSHLERLLDIAKSFNPVIKSLEEEVKSTEISWRDIDLFLQESNISYQEFADNILGGMTTRETVNRGVLSNAPIKPKMKYIILMAFKTRKKWILNAQRRWHQHPENTICETCGGFLSKNKTCEHERWIELWEAESTEDEESNGPLPPNNLRKQQTATADQRT